MALLETIVASLIEGICTIIAAVVAGGFIGRLLQKEFSAHFTQFSYSNHNIHRIMRTASDNIYIIACNASNLLRDYKNNIIEYMKKGVTIRLLIQDIDRFTEMEHYSEPHRSQDDIDELRNKTLQIIRELQASYPNHFIVKLSSLLFTASYIGVDLGESVPASADSIIQIELYQYKTEPRKSLITTISPKTDPNEFRICSDCILEMWADGTPLKTN